VDERNRETASYVDRLGLPEYFAMEAYVVRRDGAPIEPEVMPTSALHLGPWGRRPPASRD
jgi:hypothetical protein